MWKSVYLLLCMVGSSTHTEGIMIKFIAPLYKQTALLNGGSTSWPFVKLNLTVKLYER
jgi:hypothetical protein